jgi:chromosome segregation ATPase
MIKKIWEFIKKHFKIILLGGLIIYAGITTYNYHHLRSIYQSAVTGTNDLKRNLDIEIGNLKISLSKANGIVSSQRSEVDKQRELIGKLEEGKRKLEIINRRLEEINSGLESTNNRLTELINSITGLQHDIATNNSDSINIARECLRIIQELEDSLR